MKYYKTQIHYFSLIFNSNIHKILRFVITNYAFSKFNSSNVEIYQIS